MKALKLGLLVYYRIRKKKRNVNSKYRYHTIKTQTNRGPKHSTAEEAINFFSISSWVQRWIDIELTSIPHLQSFKHHCQFWRGM